MKQISKFQLKELFKKKWLKRLMEQGYLAKVCYGFDISIHSLVKRETH